MAITEEEARARALGWGEHFATGNHIEPVHDEGWIRIYKRVFWVEIGEERCEYPWPWGRPRLWARHWLCVISFGRYHVQIDLDRDRTPPF